MPVQNEKTHISSRGQALADFDSVAMCQWEEHDGSSGREYREKGIQHGGSIDCELGDMVGIGIGAVNEMKNRAS